jgi:hypothetical protein
MPRSMSRSAINKNRLNNGKNLFFRESREALEDLNTLKELDRYREINIDYYKELARNSNQHIITLPDDTQIKKSDYLAVLDRLDSIVTKKIYLIQNINELKNMGSEDLKSHKKRFSEYLGDLKTLQSGNSFPLGDGSMITKEDFTDALNELIEMINAKNRNSSSSRTAQGRKRTKQRKKTKQHKKTKSDSSNKKKKSNSSKKKRRRRR